MGDARAPAARASAFPTAGALYHWAAILGGPGAGWATAWLNTVGQFAITAAIDYGLAAFLAPLLGWEADRLHVLPLFALVLVSHALLNHLGVGVVALCWVAFMLVVMSLPPNGKAGLVFLGTVALLAAAWFLGVRRSFKGPLIPVALRRGAPPSA